MSENVHIEPLTHYLAQMNIPQMPPTNILCVKEQRDLLHAFMTHRALPPGISQEEIPLARIPPRTMIAQGGCCALNNLTICGSFL